MNEYLTELLRKYLFNEEIHYDSEVNLNELFKLASNSGVSGIVADILIPIVPKELIPNLQRFYLATYQKGLMFDNVFNEICREFEENEISVITYKGIILKHLYKEPQLRLMGDIDFTFNEKDADKVISIFNKLDFNLDKHDNHYVFTKGYIIIEMHTSIHSDEMKDFKEILNDIDNYLEPMGEYKYIKTMTKTYHLLFIITHLTKHILHGGAGIRNYIDIALFIEKYNDSIDYNFIENKLDQINLKSFYLNILGFTKKSLLNSINVLDISDETYNKFLKFTYSGNNYGLLGKERQEITYITSGKSKLMFKLSKAFPNFTRLKTIYPNLKYKIQMPYYWFKRLCKFIFKDPQKVVDNLSYDKNRILEFSELLNNMQYPK